LRKRSTVNPTADVCKRPPLLTWLVFDFILDQKREKITFM
jgi:hypothetical protein